MIIYHAFSIDKNICSIVNKFEIISKSTIRNSIFSDEELTLYLLHHAYTQISSIVGKTTTELKFIFQVGYLI